MAFPARLIIIKLGGISFSRGGDYEDEASEMLRRTASYKPTFQRYYLIVPMMETAPLKRR
jgi:hypothetical protein